MKAISIITRAFVTLLLLWIISTVGSLAETNFRVGVEAPIAVNQVEDSAEPYVAAEGARKIGKLIPVTKVALSLLVLFLLWKRIISDAVKKVKEMEG